MAKFFILHLSDLHICDSITITLEKLIYSISKNKELHNNELIITITGDIINRADYDKYEETAIEFFKQLKKALDNSKINVHDIIIVPGNHDKKTEASNKLFSIAQQSGVDFFDKDNTPSHMPSEEEVVSLQSKAFENHLQLCNKIFEIFKIKQKNKTKTYNSTFGVEKIIINGSDAIFIRINTAISCYGCPGDGEKYHLTVGQHQLDILTKQYKKLKNQCNANTLTFGLSHHPISYLISKEVTKVNRYLISENLLNVDYFLSGHIHDGSLTNLSNHNRSMVSLETGIGWPDSPEGTRNEHRYAIYCFDEEKRVFYTSMFKTNKANDFNVDSDYLLTNQERRNGKIYNPLRTRDYAFISLNDFENSNTQYLFVDSDSINTLKQLFSTIRRFSSFCTRLLYDYAERYIDLLLQDESTSKETREYIVKIINESLINNESCNPFETFRKSIYSIKNLDKKTLYNLFLSYLQHICDSFYENFKDYFADNSECRAVFRIYSKNDDKYIPICSSPPYSSPRNKNVANTSGKPREYNYEESLIKYAFDKKRSIVYSINTEKHYFKPDNWDDFIVIVPEVENYTFRDQQGRFASRPAISFVFSVRLKSTNDQSEDKLIKQAHRLYLLQFSEVEQIISSFLLDFLDQREISMKDFINENYNNHE